MSHHLRRPHGFTLVELAIVLVIVALLTGGMLLSVSAQSNARDMADARKQLGEIKDALLGFAAVNGRLPCPDTDTDPASSGYGIEDATVAACSSEGYLPWKTLGTYEFDPWGSHRTQSGDPAKGRWRYRVDTAFAPPGGTISLTTNTTDGLSVVDHNGLALTNSAPSDRPVAIVYSFGPDGIASGKNADATPAEFQSDTPGQGFDDLLIWISRPILFNRLIAAGRSL